MKFSLEWMPFIDQRLIALLLMLSVIMALLSWRIRTPRWMGRSCVFLLLALCLLAPSLQKEDRQKLPNKVLMVVDASASQKIGEREGIAKKSLQRLQTELTQHGFEPVMIESAVSSLNGREGTYLFTALRNALPGLGLSQISGAVFITDGQVHDVPISLAGFEKVIPFNAILTGRPDEFDRKVTLVSAPKYGVLGQDIKIAVKVEEFGSSYQTPFVLSVFENGEQKNVNAIQKGEIHEFSFRLNHVGQNIFEFSLPVEKGELTAANNTVAIIVNTVRDRLRVLLVSGSPHMGERAWRNLLKSDPSVDLVHFTILRSASSFDLALPDELSLIVFPVEELFQRKLKDFDLVIFDKYRQVQLLTPLYFYNLAAYVRNGGALLLALGPHESKEEGVFSTALADILPVAPQTGALFPQSYLPKLSDLGHNHPVTAELSALFDKAPWGPWYTQTLLTQKSGQELITGIQDHPLLILDQVNKGRVAVLASDNVWMWSKGGTFQGPYTQLLRNTAHWLMKEPELEEGYMRAVVEGGKITVSKRTLSGQEDRVSMTRPSGQKENVTLTNQDQKGWISAIIEAKESGIYTFLSGEKKTVVVVGGKDNLELSEVQTTDQKLRPIIEQSGGKMIWFSHNPNFSLSDLRFEEKSVYSVRNIESQPLLPDIISVFIILMVLILSWWYESGRRKKTK